MLLPFSRSLFFSMCVPKGKVISMRGSRHGARVVVRMCLRKYGRMRKSTKFWSSNFSGKSGRNSSSRSDSGSGSSTTNSSNSNSGAPPPANTATTIWTIGSVLLYLCAGLCQAMR